MCAIDVVERPLRRQLRAAAAAELERARQPLRRGGNRNAHTVRKHIKRLRAWRRLAAADDAAARRLERRLRHAAHRLAAQRDREVLAAMLQRLRRGRHLNAAEHARLLAALPAIDDAAEAQAEARHALKHGRAALAGIRWPRQAMTLRRRIAASRSACRRDFAAAAAAPRAEVLHRWRRHLKRLGYQYELLGALLPQAFADTAPLAALEATLGLHHDWWLLQRWAEATTLPPRLKQRLLALAAQRLDRLAALALRRGAALFA
ncbi:CHAD domain-containing protein [Solimonas flava]|uniref:CHAD domain-containing protein n=1 Tax=Solimonas flava TaxID=415849 RepID=UPI000426ED98|nr:CHAD domain-containing protein [Solimonas flava]